VLAFALQSGFYITDMSGSANGAIGVATTFRPLARRYRDFAGLLVG
jgi:hypothetical protein